MSHFVTTVPVLGWTWSPGCFWSSWCPWSLWSCGFSWSKWCSWWSWTWCKLSFILVRLLFFYSEPKTNTQKKWIELEAVLLANLYNVFRENYIRIFIDMDSYAQLGDKFLKHKLCLKYILKSLSESFGFLHKCQERWSGENTYLSGKYKNWSLIREDYLITWSIFNILLIQILQRLAGFQREQRILI